MELRDERGQSTPLLALTIVAVAAIAVVITALGRTADDRAQARTAADAAALAGAATGEDEARAIANANGATLVRFERDGPYVEVQVAVGSTLATARAQASTRWVPD